MFVTWNISQYSTVILDFFFDGGLDIFPCWQVCVVWGDLMGIGGWFEGGILIHVAHLFT
jgi:hypothetical protein